MRLPWENMINNIIRWLRFFSTSPSPRSRQDLASQSDALLALAYPWSSTRRHSIHGMRTRRFRIHQGSPNWSILLASLKTPWLETLMTMTSIESFIKKLFYGRSIDSSFTSQGRMPAQGICCLSHRAMCRKCAQGHREIPAATFLTAPIPSALWRTRCRCSPWGRTLPLAQRRRHRCDAA